MAKVQFSRECFLWATLSHHPLRKNAPTSGKGSLRAGRREQEQDFPGGGGADLQRQRDDDWREIKTSSISFSSREAGKTMEQEERQRKQPVRAPKKAEMTLSHHKSPVAALPPGPLASGFTQSIWALPSPSTGCALPPRPPTLTRCWCCTSHTCGAWVGWPEPWKWAGRTADSAS